MADIPYASILAEIHASLIPQEIPGKVADYIPELGKVSPDKWGMHLCCLSGREFGLGDNEERFSIQSIAKVLALSFAFGRWGESIWRRVDVEPSGDPFNSLVQLEFENGIPRNPLINAGALVISDLLVEHLAYPKEAFLAYVRKVANNPGIGVNEKVAQSEKAWGDRNAALLHLMKSFGNIHCPVEAVLDFYVHMCAIEMSCVELARTFLFLANHGVLAHSGERMLSISQAKRLNAIMQTCGFYDEAGEFAYRVGLPGKSGVGGGIAAVHPNHYSVAVWSPKLNPKGNSALGMKALERLTTHTGLSIF